MGRSLKVFFAVAHDPTELNRQGPDEGTQYRSSIFYASDEQKAIADAYIQQLNNAHVFSRPIVTTVVPLKGFYAAEDYHQDFIAHNPDYPYVVVNDLPKLQSAEGGVSGAAEGRGHSEKELTARIAGSRIPDPGSRSPNTTYFTSADPPPPRPP